MQSTDMTPLPTAFRRIGWSNLFAQFSEQIALAAAPLAAVLLLAAGPAETGWLQTAQGQVIAAAQSEDAGCARTQAPRPRPDKRRQ